MAIPLRLPHSLLLIGTGLLVACQDQGPTQPKERAPVLAGIELIAPDSVLMLGDSMALAATAHDETGSAMAQIPITWESSNATVAEVSSTGIVRTLQTGSTLVRVTAGAFSDSVTIRIGVPATAPDTALQIHVNPADPVVATLPAKDGEVLQYLGEKTADGDLIRLTGWRKYAPGDREQFDALHLNEAGRAERVSLRDGSQVQYSYQAGGQVRMTITLPDGNSIVSEFGPNATGTTRSGESAARQSPERRLRLEGRKPDSFRSDATWRQRGPRATAVSGTRVADKAIRLQVRVSAGDSQTTPLTGVLVDGTWDSMLDGPKGAFVANETAEAGVYETVISFDPTPSVSLATIQRLCERFAGATGPACEAIAQDDFFAHAAKACAALLLVPGGQPFVAPCEAAVALAALTCNVSTACDVSKSAIDLFVPKEATIDLVTRATSVNLNVTKTLAFSPPHKSPWVVDFRLPLTFSLGLQPYDPGPGESYRAITQVYPKIRDVHVEMSVSGSDGYEDSDAGPTNDHGQFRLYVPGAAAHVADVIRSKVGDQVRTLTIIF